MKIIVCSCDKNSDLFEPFHHCMEKYYLEHPEIVYSTETVFNPYYKTICHDYPLNQWTKRIRETVQEMRDEHVLFMMDDIFIRKPVDLVRLKYAEECLSNNVAMVNLELEWDDNIDVRLDRIKLRRHGAPYELSLMCGLWNADALMDILSEDNDPWSVEIQQKTKGYNYLINAGDYIIDWGYKTYQYCGVMKGKWCREVVPFFEKEGIKIDYSKRGFHD